MATILVADDERSIRGLLTAILTSAGHSVYEAANGLEAVAVFRSHAKDIQLVVIDMMMPEMNGSEAVERIRQTRPDVPVICISGYTDRQIPAGTSFLRKPFMPKVLLGLVGQLLGS